MPQTIFSASADEEKNGRSVVLALPLPTMEVLIVVLLLVSLCDHDRVVTQRKLMRRMDGFFIGKYPGFDCYKITS